MPTAQQKLDQIRAILDAPLVDDESSTPQSGQEMPCPRCQSRLTQGQIGLYCETCAFTLQEKPLTWPITRINCFRCGCKADRERGQPSLCFQCEEEITKVVETA